MPNAKIASPTSADVQRQCVLLMLINNMPVRMITQLQKVPYTGTPNGCNKNQSPRREKSKSESCEQQEGLFITMSPLWFEKNNNTHVFLYLRGLIFF